jgi:peptide/nickel transport system ATP-binding protein
MTTDNLLIDVRQLSVGYRRRPVGGTTLSLSMAQGETVAIVGESGSGKSTLANAILGLLPDHAQISAGQLWVGGNDLSHASERQKRLQRGRTVGLVPRTRWSASTRPCASASKSPRR